MLKEGLGTALGNRDWAKVSDLVNLPSRLRLSGERLGEEAEHDAGDERSSIHYQALRSVSPGVWAITR
jgi:hypothetical protein